VLRAGQVVKAQVLAIDPEKRQIKLSMKQLIPTEIDEYIAEHKVGDTVSGRVVEQSMSLIHVELGDGIRAICRTGKTPSAPVGTSVSSPAAGVLAPPQVAEGALAPPQVAAKAASAAPQVPKLDLSALSSQLKSRWKGHSPAPQAKPDAFSEGQIRSFKITRLDPEAKKIEVELA